MLSTDKQQEVSDFVQFLVHKLGSAELEYELSFTKKLNDPKSLSFARS